MRGFRMSRKEISHVALKRNVQKYARLYIGKGWAAVPIPARQKFPNHESWQKLRLTKEQVADLFDSGGNLGLLLGKPSHGLVDVDLDTQEAVELASEFLPTTDRVHGRKSRRCSHYWYFVRPAPAPVKLCDTDGTTLLELRSTGQQTLVPPSIHPNGERIRWEKLGDPAKVNACTLEQDVKRLAACVLVARHWPAPGSRHEAALALAGTLLRWNWRLGDVVHFISLATRVAGDDEWAKRAADAKSTAKKLAQNDPATGATRLEELVGTEVVARLRLWLAPTSTRVESFAHHCSDLGNARQFVEDHGQSLRYCYAIKKWIVWDGARWRLDSDGEVNRRAKQTALNLYAEAANEADPDRRQQLGKWALSSESRGRIEAMIDLAKSEPGIPVAPEELDADPWVLNCANGTIDLRTGQLTPFRREALCTKQIPVAFDPDAKCPIWKSFLGRIMNENKELVNFLRRSVGYALTGDTSEQVIFIHHGSGANGKSTFMEAIRTLLGDYGKSADSTLLTMRKGDGVRNDVARLAGARFVSTAETESGRRLAETLVKQLTGGDTISARFLYAEFFEFSAQFKLFLSTNHKPVIRGTDKAIWRRIRLVPFEVTIPDDEQDSELPAKLRTELPGILAWALRGCLSWQQYGLGKPEKVADATAAYREEMDTLGGFLHDRCVLNKRAKTTTGELFKAYLEWCGDTAERPLTQRDFGIALGERGLKPSRTGKARYWNEIELVTDDAE